MRTVVFLFCSLMLFINSLSAQISRYELCWAIFHPVAAVKVHIIKQRCDRMADTINTARLDSFSSGGKLDAFRHSFYMAAFAQKVNARKLRRLGIAHEKANYRQFLRSKLEHGELPDSLASVMDLHNNELGFQIGAANRKLPLNALKETVITEIRKGSALILRRNAAGKYLDCDGKPVAPERKWNLPKCLLESSALPG